MQSLHERPSSAASKTSTIGKEQPQFIGGFSTHKPSKNSNKYIWALVNSFLAAAFCRVWSLILLSSSWATAVTLLNTLVHDISVQPILLTVYGTVVGCFISYRVSVSFERYNDGRRSWSTIILATRTLARTVWFHVPDTPNSDNLDDQGKGLLRARSLIEKRTVINLVEAFSVAVKHYLRGEDGINYEDLYYLVKFIQKYRLPVGVSTPGLQNETPFDSPGKSEGSPPVSEDLQVPLPAANMSPGLPVPVTSNDRSRARGQIAPASNPPRSGICDAWPFSLLAKSLKSEGKHVNENRAKKERVWQEPVSHNIPLEITWYLSSYISALQQRKAIDVPTTNTLILGLNQLVDALSGLERASITPIPFSYGVHLWTVCGLYVFLMPFQLWKSFGYVTIPITAIAAFFFFGFLAAGEEIEHPFGYGKNDLDLDYFCHNIIHAELTAITSTSVGDPTTWALLDENGYLFGKEDDTAGVPPAE